LLDAAQSWRNLAEHIEKNGIADATALVHNSWAPDLDALFADPSVRMRIGAVIAGAAKRLARPKRPIKSR
jgi:hypothetical protein